MATELASAYLTLIPSLKGAARTIQSELSGVDVSHQGRAIGSSLMEPVRSAAKGAVAALGGIGGALGSIAAQGGMARALNLEKAQTMFKGMKLEWEDYRTTIQDAVDGTVFSFDEAALMSANLAASGVAAGEDMAEALRGAVGVASTFGAGLADIGGIYQKVAAQGKLTNETIAQFSDRGINVTSVMADALGVAQEEVKDLARDGKISFAQFSEAMEATFGDSAASANETFTGSMANMRSALSRLGEKFATPIKDNAVPVFNALRLALNQVSSALQPLADRFSEVVSFLSGAVAGRLSAFTETMDAGGSAVEGLQSALGTVGGKVAAAAGAFVGIGAAASALAPLLAAVPGLGALAGALTGGAAASGTFGGALGLLRGAAAVLSGPFGAVAAVVGALAGGLVAAYRQSEPFRTALSGLGEALGGAFGALADAFGTVGAAFGECFGQLSGGDDVMGAFVSFVEGSLVPAVQSVAEFVSGTLVPAIESAAGFLADYVVPLLAELAQGVIDNVVPALEAFASFFADSLLPFLGQLAGSVLGAVGSAFGAVADTVATVLPPAMELAGEVMEGLWNVVQAVWPVVQDVVTSVVGFVAEAVETYIPPAMELAGEVMSFLMGVVQDVWPSIEALILAVVSAVAGFMATYWPQIQAVVTSAMDVVMAVVQTVWPHIQAVVESVMGVIQSVIGVVTAAISGDWEGVWTGVRDLLQGIWDTMGTIVSEGIGLVVDLVKSLPDKILGFFSNAGNLLKDAGSAIIDGLLNGLKAAWEGVKDFVGGLGDWIFEHKGPKQYDLRLLVPNGRWIMESLSKGLLSGRAQVDDALGRITRGIASYSFDLSASAPSRTGGALAGNTYYTMGDVTVDASSLEDVLTMEKLFKALGMAKAVA